MSAAMQGRPSLYSTAVGKKYVMAISGMVLMTYVLAHMIGNLKVYFGASSLDRYSAWLREVGEPALPREALLADADALIAQTGTPLTGTTAVPGVVGAADAVRAAHQGQEFEFTRFRDPDAVRWYIVGHDSGNFDKDWLLEKLEQGRVRLYCTLDIISASDSASIGEWRWRAEIELEPGENPNPGPGGVGSGPVMDSGQPADTLHLAFDVGPTSG